MLEELREALDDPEQVRDLLAALGRVDPRVVEPDGDGEVLVEPVVGVHRDDPLAELVEAHLAEDRQVAQRRVPHRPGLRGAPV